MVDDVDNSDFLFTRDMMIFDEGEWTPFNCLDWADKSRHYRQRRCDYFYKKINEIEDNEKVKYDIFMRLKKVSGDLFDWSYLNDNGDCFINVLDALFDSDSYFELNNKLEAVEAAAIFCKTSFFKLQTFEKLLERLKSDRYKDSCNNKIIKYSDDACKSKKIIDRMKELYVNISDDDLVRVHNNSDSVSDLVLSLGKVNKEIKEDDYNEFCNKYINKIETDLESSLILFPKFENKLFVALESPRDDGFRHLTASFGSASWEERKKYIIIKLKELGLNKEFRDKFISCYDKNEYGFLNLYLIAVAYEFQKNNFENFSSILDDIVVVSDYCTDFTSSEFFKYFVGYFIACEDYKDMISMRECFSEFLNCFNGNYYSSVVYDVARKDLYLESEDSYIVNEMYSLNMKKIFDGREIFCNKFLMKRRGRLSYINSKLYEIESNKNLRDELFLDICGLSYEMFEELNINNESDAFLECMKIVFDSDSYYELNKKVSLLKEASDWFREGFKSEAFGLVRILNSDDNKEVLNGNIVKYSNNCINVVSKPKKIIDRMKELYPKFDESISYDFLDNVHSNVKTIDELGDFIINYRKNPINKIKQKFKNFRIRK